MARLNSFALLLATLAALACGPSAAPRPAPAELSIVIDTLALRAHTFFLSDDRLMGRETTSPGADIAALYISAACRSLGLEAIGSEFGLPIPLESVNMRGSTLGIRVGEADHTYRAPSDFVAQGGTSRAVADLTGRPVLVGGQDDILAGRTPTLTGAIAVTLGLVASAAAQDTLIAHGAVGIVQLTSDENAFREWADQEGAPLLYLADSAAQSSYYPNLPSLVAGPTPSRVLIAARGSVGPGPIDASIAMHVRGDRHRVPARNIGCVLRGNDPAAADTAIAFTAHYDHLGIGAPDASGDSIYNGFSDNAAGVAMLLAIAQSMAHREHHRHSVLFLFFTGEERGLLGSDYYVAHPAWPLARVATAQHWVGWRWMSRLLEDGAR
jgi:hypothetical protein